MAKREQAEGNQASVVKGKPRSEEVLPSLTTSADPEAVDPELFFGLVAPIGAPKDALLDALQVAMERVNYGLEVIKLSDLLSRLEREGGVSLLDEFSNRGQKNDQKSYYDTRIELGDWLSEHMGEAPLVALGITRLHEIREELAALYPGRVSRPAYADHNLIKKQAYCFDSLKRPAEIDRLREIYKGSLIVISAHAPRDHRVGALSRKVASSTLQFNPDLARSPAEELVTKDESEETSHGQNVLQAYHKADFFISVAGTRQSIGDELWRFLSMLFGYPFHTPKPDEQGMALAYLAALRSAHPARQVGAAITTEDGSVVAVGCNEVPKAFGGLYWPNDDYDQRDFQLKEYESLAIRQEILADILERLGVLEFLTLEKKKELEEDQEKFFARLNSWKDYKKLRDSRLMDALEFDRTVHAEMAAITDAARRGVSLRNCTLYSTTFPCHNCARHIVAAGIRRVVYIQPFAKSLTKRLHGDAICVDAESGTEGGKVRFDPFLGIAPTLYSTLFTIRRRLDVGANWKRFIQWNQRDASPIVTSDAWAYIRDELVAIKRLKERLAQQGIRYKPKGGAHEEEPGEDNDSPGSSEGNSDHRPEAQRTNGPSTE